MCTNYEDSLYKVLSKFKRDKPSSVSSVIDATKEDVLFLDNYRLPEFIYLLSQYGYLQKDAGDNNSFLLTEKGKIKEESLENVVKESRIAPTHPPH